MEQQQRKSKIAVYDMPISMPEEEMPEEFVRLIESRFVTKRFPKPQNTHVNRNARKQENN
jgi:hypothetical protein